MIWAYNNGVYDWIEGTYNVYLFQNDGETDYFFSGSIDVYYAGASKLIAVSMAITTVYIALI